MNGWKNDIGPDEQGLLKEFGTSLEALRAKHATCPKPEVLLASHAGVLDDATAKNIATHLEKCGFCKILLRDLTDAEMFAALPEEERRVHERVLKSANAVAKAERAGGRMIAIWSWRAVPVAAFAVAVLAVVIWVRLRQPVVPVSTPPTVEVRPVQPPVPSVLQWEKLPIKLQASSVLVLRGKPRNAKEKYTTELTAALAYYRDDDYTQAAQQLAKVVRTFPDGVEAQLYLGISQLKLQQNGEAIAPLSAAQKFGPPPFREDATWFLALAYERTHDTQKALAELQKMCQGKGSYSQRACTGIQELSAQPGDKPQR